MLGGAVESSSRAGGTDGLMGNCESAGMHSSNDKFHPLDLTAELRLGGQRDSISF